MPYSRKLRIADFQAFPNKVTYVLAAGGKGYFVQNVDTNLKDAAGNSQDRNVTLGRLDDDADWTPRKSGIPVYENFSAHLGLPFEGLLYSGGKLQGVKGDMRRNEEGKGYTMVHVSPNDITSSKLEPMFDKSLIEYIEHFMVPDVMASQVRSTSTVPAADYDQLEANNFAGYGKIIVKNLQRRPDRMIYMLEDDTDDSLFKGKNPTFVVINNDSDMDNSYALFHKNWKTDIKSPRTRRHITVARLIDKEDEKKLDLPEGLKGEGSTLFKGFAYPRFFDGSYQFGIKCVQEVEEKKKSSEYPELYPATGRIESNFCYEEESEKNKSYTTINEMHSDDTPADAVRLLTPAILQQLERFTVPHEMAEMIRNVAKAS
jgi:hypothetical protein